MNQNGLYDLGQVTDLFMNERGITKKKYFSQYLIHARFAWKDIFKNTLFTTMSEWLTVQRGDPFNYIIIPKDAEKIFSVSVEDDCHNVVPLFYNNRLNVVKKPTQKKCGCTVCDCAGLCADANALQMTTKLIFTINGQEYFEKIYVETCSNGDVLEYRITPVKKYNDLTGDGGDFNEDFNNDYLIGQVPFSDFTIEYITTQKKICKLEVAPCGCPLETESNIQVFNTYCGCYLNCCSPIKKRCCDDFLENPNNNERGEAKISPCGNYIYYKPAKHWRQVTDRKVPEFLLLNYQTNGETCSQGVMVPEYCLDVMFAGMNWRSKRSKDGVSYNDKLACKWQYEAARNEVILNLNRFSLEELSHIQSSRIKW